MKKKLTRSNKNVILTGTSAGTGEYIEIDPTVICILYVLLSLVASGSSIVSYILLALIAPSARPARANYGHGNTYYEKNNYREQTREQTKKRKEAGKIDNDERNDF